MRNYESSMRNNDTTKQRNCETTKERCETAKGRCETTKLRNTETVKQRERERARRPFPDTIVFQYRDDKIFVLFYVLSSLSFKNV